MSTLLSSNIGGTATKRRSDEATKGKSPNADFAGSLSNPSSLRRSVASSLPNPSSLPTPSSLRRSVASSLPNPSSLRHSAFTLTEILIVVGIIVLLVVVSLPAFNLISGGKSIEGATNQLSAALGRARAQAIGLQEPTGVMFFLDPKTQRRSFAIVQAVDGPSSTVVWLDLVANTDIIPLPAGVGVQFIDDCGFTPANVRTDDGYIGLNTVTHNAAGTLVTTAANYGGVILFDATGQLLSKAFGFRCSTGINAGAAITAMGQLLLPSTYNITPGPVFLAPSLANTNTNGFALKSQFGLVFYELDTYTNAGFSDIGDQQVITGTNSTYSTGSPPTEISKENWLDQNATPLMINRYTGAIVKGE